MKQSEINELTTQELKDRTVAEADSLVKLKMNQAVSPLDNPIQIRMVRRTIARIKTELKQREISEAKTK